jgi:hypothetical protein
MIPGPTIIRECSACGKYIAEGTIVSGNTFGARLWTDGKLDAPMLPDEPRLVKCRHCGSLVWIEEEKQVGEIDPWCSENPGNDAFEDARPAKTPTLRDYVGFLKAGISDKEKERYVRLRAWWAGNDGRRKSNKTKPLTSFESNNLRAFATLLPEADDNDRLMKAEALRELGQFEEAEKLLAAEFESEFAKVVSTIRELNEKRNAGVAEITE